MFGDLHCHTRLSDGSSTIDDLIFYSKRGGLDFIAVTDHDTMAGTVRADILGKRYGVRVIPGVEISAWDTARGRPVHILGYNPKKPERILSITAKVLENRTLAGQEMIRKVMDYYPITPEHVARYSAGSKSIYKVHIMHAIMDLGYTADIKGALYHQLFDKDGSCYVPIAYPDVHHAIDAIHSAGGVVVMAHPMDYDSVDLLQELCQQRLLDGIECSHPRCTSADKAMLQEIAQKYKLIETGGTDFHGFYSGAPNPLGSCITQGPQIDRIFKYPKAK